MIIALTLFGAYTAGMVIDLPIRLLRDPFEGLDLGVEMAGTVYRACSLSPQTTHWLNENLTHWSYLPRYDGRVRPELHLSEEDATLFRLRFGLV